MLRADADTLRARIVSLESELSLLKQQLSEVERLAASSKTTSGELLSGSSHEPPTFGTGPEHKWPLCSDEYTRYGRQMIMPEIGLHGQLSLRESSVLIIGVGGLGCPAAQYLAGAGVGTIGLVDGDVVEWSNLHRQILHTTERVGHLKVDSAITGLRQLNPYVRFVAHREHLTPHTALATMKDYDLILDCTDHPSSRYLISDSAVLSGKILISGSALRTEGQLMVLNNPPGASLDRPGGPCYRCVFPKPPPADTVISCGDGGILGPVVGVIGVLMALKAIQVLTTGAKRGYENESQPMDDQPTMLLFSAYTNPPFRQIRLCGKRKNCVACSSSPKISADSLASGSLDYEVLCGAKTPIQTLNPDERIEAKELNKIIFEDRKPHILLDVRDRTQFSICNLAGTINIPFSDIQAMSKVNRKEKSTALALLEDIDPDTPIYTVCRFGNDSQLTVRKLKALGLDNGGERWIGDVRGGYKAWKQQVDPHWPEY